MSPVAETRDRAYTFEGAELGTHRFTVITISLNGYDSTGVSIEHTINSGIRELTPPSNLQLVDGVSSTTFDSLSPTFQWSPSDDPFLDHYVVRIKHTNGALKRETISNSLRYTYEFNDNKIDFSGTQSRSFIIEVYASDALGNVSQPISMVASNPTPAAPTDVAVNTDMFMAFVTYTKSSERDWAGASVHASTTDNFIPSDANRIYRGPNTQVRTKIDEGQTLYFKVGFYDSFDESDINYSSQVSTIGNGLVVNSVSYLKLSTELQDTIDMAAAGGGLSTTVSNLVTQTNNLADETYGSWRVQIVTQNNIGGGSYKVVSGFGLAQAGGGGETTSDFVVMADRFSIMPAYDGVGQVAKYPVFAVGTRNGIASVGIRGDMVLDGSIYAQALNVGSLSAVNANLGTVTAGVAKSTDDKFVIDLTNRTITISD